MHLAQLIDLIIQLRRPGNALGVLLLEPTMRIPEPCQLLVELPGPLRTLSVLGLQIQ